MELVIDSRLLSDSKSPRVGVGEGYQFGLKAEG